MSANKFITERNHHLLLVPFLYAFFSRIRGLRAFGFNALTLWAPGLILSAGLSGGSPDEVLARYFAGYLIFISVYEMGYLMNDTWGLRHDEIPRRRIAVDYKPAFYVLFAGIRLATVGILGAALGALAGLWFWGLLGLLALAILAHNLLVRQEFKMATFFQMSLMRFCTPVFIATSMTEAAVVLAVGALFFVFPRFLTYQDSKGRLQIPERKNPDFALGMHLLFAPIAALVTLASGHWVALAVWLYFVTYAGAVFLGARSGRLRAFMAGSGSQ